MRIFCDVSFSYFIDNT